MTFQSSLEHTIVDSSICKSGAVFNDKYGNICNAMRELQLESKIKTIFTLPNKLCTELILSNMKNKNSKLQVCGINTQQG